jgi:NADP-dependent 3-hydroxy acid dehydrogenase YdfG
MLHDKMKADAMNKTEGGIALVTGASSGIGLATARALRADRYRVFGTSRKPTPRMGSRC